MNAELCGISEHEGKSKTDTEIQRCRNGKKKKKKKKPNKTDSMPHDKVKKKKN